MSKPAVFKLHNPCRIFITLIYVNLHERATMQDHVKILAKYTQLAVMLNLTCPYSISA